MLHLHPAGLGMTGHIGERFLGDAKSTVRLAVSNCSTAAKRPSNECGRRSARELFHEGMQGGNQSEIIQHRRAQFAGELMHDVHRFFHQPLRAGDVAVEILGVAPGLLWPRPPAGR